MTGSDIAVSNFTKCISTSQFAACLYSKHSFTMDLQEDTWNEHMADNLNHCVEILEKME